MKPQDIIVQNVLLRNITLFSKLLWKSIDSNINRYKKVRKLATGQSEHYPTEFLLDFDYIMNHYRQTAVDLNR